MPGRMYNRHSQAVYLGDLRGRTAGKITHFERIAADIAAQLAEARKDLEAVDRIIKQFDPRIDPASIPLFSPEARSSSEG